MRGLFSMLFGAGVILLTTRAEQRGAGHRAADIYLRRSLWLLAFGMLHTMFLWDGDILYEYALNAIFFLYPLRILKPKGLFLAAACAFLVFVAMYLSFFNLPKYWRLTQQIGAVHAAQQAGRQLNPQQTQVLHDWTAIEKARSPQGNAATEMAIARGGYKTYHEAHGGSTVLMNHAKYYAVGITFEPLTLMLLGMGLFKCGFLRGERSYATYLWTALLSGLIATPITVLGLWKTYASGGDY